MMIQSEVHTQTTDTSKLWIKRTDALKVLAAADSLKAYKIALMQCGKDVDTLIKIANLKQSQINNLLNADKSNQDAITLLKNQKDELNSKIISDEKLLKKERRRKKLTMFGGIAGMSAILFLYLTK